MYYSQQSPGIAHKLANHHDQSPWSRAHHPVLGPPGTQPNVGPPPPSPGYAIYTNGNLQHHPTHHPLAHAPMPHHHHQNSLGHYPSPPNSNSHQQHILQGSPSSVAGQTITPQWQQQLLKCEMIRSSRSPHHRARASAMASRIVAKAAIPITNPNAIKPPPPPSEPTDSPTDTKASADEASPTAGGAAVDHPSSTVAPVTELTRPTEARPPQNTWNSLDMGGVNIKNLPPTSGLFGFKFLINLYLNHNALSTVPPEIAKLRYLEVLDLSGNQIATVPPELGLLSHLKELYLFDNHVTTLPVELGNLHQLQTLGVEGNPLDASLKALIQKDGTRSLVTFLRDAYHPPKPPTRQWRDVIPSAERIALNHDPSIETITVTCYNILCERCATERLYGYTPSWALAWEYRRDKILEEILEYDADFVCLQEVDIGQYEEHFTKRLAEKGYEGVFWPKSRYKNMNESDRKLVDGCATFYKSERYQLVEKHLVEFSQVAMQRSDFKKTDDMFNRVLGKDHIAVICQLENRETGTRYIIANTHIHWDPAYRDVKLVQVGLLLDEIEKIANNFAKYPPRLPPTPSPASATAETGVDDETGAPAPRPVPVYSDGSKIPTIICGDFNSVAESGVYELLANGAIPANHPDFMSHMYGKYTSDGIRHRLGLKNAYAAAYPGPPSEEFPITNYVPSFRGAIDYVWYSAANLGVNAVLGEVDKGYLEKVVGFPNPDFPSDHICLVSEFRVKPPRETPPRPPPVFS